MIIVGTMDTKDDADLLPDVLDSLSDFDAVFAYNDGSQDNSLDILRNHPNVTKVVSKSEFSPAILSSVPQHRRRHLLQWVKDEYRDTQEPVWIVRLEGDRFFRSDPVLAIREANDKGLESICGVMLDYRLDPSLDWRDFDTWPNWNQPIRKIQTWARIDDIHPIVAFRLRPTVSYEDHKIRPWPKVAGPSNYLPDDMVSTDMLFLDHHGRRGPKYWSWAYGTSGSRVPSKKWPKHWDFSSPEAAHKTVDDGPFMPPKLWDTNQISSWIQMVNYWNNQPPRNVPLNT